MESVPQRGSVWPGFANQKLNSDCGSSQHATALWYRPHPLSPSPCRPVYLSPPVFHRWARDSAMQILGDGSI